MATRAELMAEAYRRGILPSDKAALYEEGVRRGLVKDDYAAGKSKSKGVLGVASSMASTLNESIPFMDEAAAGLGAGLRTLQGQGSFADNWKTQRQVQQGQQAALRDKSRLASDLTTGIGYAAQAIPAMMSGGGTLAPSAAPVAKNIFARVGTRLAKNGVQGAAYAAGNVFAGRGNLSERTQDANAAILPGAVVGMAAPELVNGISATSDAVRKAAAPAVRATVRAANNVASRTPMGPFLNPETEAFKRLGETLKADKFTPQEIQSAMTEWNRVGGPSPAFMDLINQKGRGQRTMALIRGAAMTGGGRNAAAEYGSQVAADLQDNAIARTRALTPETRPAADVAKGMRDARGKLATEQYRGPYNTQVPISDEVRSVLSDAPGRTALRSARADALERRDMEQVAEIDRLLNPPAPSGGVTRVPGVEAPEPPPVNEDPRGQSFLTYLRQLGGLKDDGGELAAMDLGRSNGKFQKDHLINPNGISLEEAAQRAWEDGWFPDAKVNLGAGDNYHPVDEAMMREAIRKAVAGRPVSQEWAMQEDQAARHRWMDDVEDPHPPQDAAYWASLGSEGKQTVSGSVLDRAQIAMRERADKLSRNSNNSRAAGTRDRRAVINQALDQVPQLKEARQAYRDASQQIEGVEKVGPGVLREMPDAYAANVERLGPGARPAVQVGAARALEEQIGAPAEGSTGALNRIGTATNAGRNLETTFGPQPAADYRQAINQMRDQLNNARFINPNTGSQTAGRLADETLVENIPQSKTGLVMAIIRKVRMGATLTDAEREALVRVATAKPGESAARITQSLRAPVRIPRQPQRNVANVFAIPHQENQR